MLLRAMGRRVCGMRVCGGRRRWRCAVIGVALEFVFITSRTYARVCAQFIAIIGAAVANAIIHHARVNVFFITLAPKPSIWTCGSAWFIDSIPTIAIIIVEASQGQVESVPREADASEGGALELGEVVWMNSAILWDLWGSRRRRTSVVGRVGIERRAAHW